MLIRRPYDERLKDDIAAAPRTPASRSSASTGSRSRSDSLVGLRNGYRTATIASFDDDKLPTNYHQPTDVADNLDWDTVQAAATSPRRRCGGSLSEADRLVARRDLLRVLRRGDLGEQPPQLRPRLDPQLPRELVAADQRRRGPVVVPVERRPEQLAGQLEVPGDRLVVLAPARREAVGDRQQQRVGGDRLASP